MDEILELMQKVRDKMNSLDEKITRMEVGVGIRRHDVAFTPGKVVDAISSTGRKNYWDEVLTLGRAADSDGIPGMATPGATSKLTVLATPTPMKQRSMGDETLAVLGSAASTEATQAAVTLDVTPSRGVNLTIPASEQYNLLRLGLDFGKKEGTKIAQMEGTMKEIKSKEKFDTMVTMGAAVIPHIWAKGPSMIRTPHFFKESSSTPNPIQLLVTAKQMIVPSTSPPTMAVGESDHSSNMGKGFGVEMVFLSDFIFSEDGTSSAGDAKLEDIKPKFLWNLAVESGFILKPMADMFGRTVGKDVVNACFGKFHSLFQFFYYDLLVFTYRYGDFWELQTLKRIWYDAQTSVFGSKLQRKREDAIVFLVGFDALSREFLKRLAAMGVSCGHEEKVTVTDVNVIEKSNLSRQLLFRDWNTGQVKSTVVVWTAKSINPILNVEVLQNRVGPKIENIFDAEFWKGLNVVVNALDNKNTRLNVYQRYLYFQKPLFKSRTVDAICDTPMVEDTWARNILKHFPKCLNQKGCEDFEDCNTETHLRLEEYFANQVEGLIYSFPKDTTTSIGTSFWSAPKISSHPLQFSVSDTMHLCFEMSTSIHSIEAHGISVPDLVKNFEKLALAIDMVKVPDLKPKKDVKIVTNEKSTGLFSASGYDEVVIHDLMVRLEQRRRYLTLGFRMEPIQFGQDTDTDHHMDMMGMLANMRAPNYIIPEVDELKAKFITGKIIHAIATSTAMAILPVCLEVCKVLCGGRKLEDYRNTFANLALSQLSIAKFVLFMVIEHRNRGWSVWDKWLMKNNSTMRELLQWFQKKGLRAYNNSCGSWLFHSLFPKHRAQRRVALGPVMVLNRFSNDTLEGKGVLEGKVLLQGKSDQ
ncbi:hypothetical protein MLD38_004708 [Melastoma candidum]|uniref:Uncharacterized protein n=1 Tax=Melastoma candidum TaxID=119954 RepID=A0ACB9SBH6_9MYRT|nr:hypothetical protein MLD38_004708 [Melastoma candidum]